MRVNEKFISFKEKINYGTKEANKFLKFLLILNSKQNPV